MPRTKMRLGGAAVIKLSPEDVEKILRDKESTNAALAERFGVSTSRIWEVRHGVSVRTLMSPQAAKKTMPTESERKTEFTSTRRRAK